MTDATQVLVEYGYLVLFAVVLLEQIGLPIPAVPVLLGVGALAGTERMSLALGIGAVLAASLPPDLVWYELGRRRGSRVLARLCRISLEPDSCVRRTENLFVRRGRKALLVVKFFPGLSPIASTLSGMVGVARRQFIALDGLGAMIWASAWMGLGYAFSDALELVIGRIGSLGNYALAIVAAALVSYIAVKFVKRQRFLRGLRIARITPDELKRRLDSGDGDLAVIDTRSALEVNREPYVIPGAIWIAAEEIDQRHREVPRDREIVLYCT
jgi:membrane protein DedA with SNARE-associated domain